MLKHFYKGWYVLYVKSRCEKKVNETLQERLLESYLPIAKKVKQWSDRKKIVYEPLFPSYVFVHIKNRNEFSKALSIDGAHGFIRFGKDFARARDEEIDNIKILLSSDLDNVETSKTLPQVGERRKIQYGVLSGLDCEIIKVNNINKVVVRIDSINLNVTATMPASYFQISLAR